MVRRENCLTHSKAFYLYIQYKGKNNSHNIIGHFDDLEEFLIFNSLKSGKNVIQDWKMVYLCEDCKTEKKKTGQKFMLNNNVARDYIISQNI